MRTFEFIEQAQQTFETKPRKSLLTYKIIVSENELITHEEMRSKPNEMWNNRKFLNQM